LLKYKHYTVIKKVPEDMVTSDKFTAEVNQTFKALYPFNRFINDGINYQLDIVS